MTKATHRKKHLIENLLTIKKSVPQKNKAEKDCCEILSLYVVRALKPEKQNKEKEWNIASHMVSVVHIYKITEMWYFDKNDP